MTRPILVDTGPIVAWLFQRDRLHLPATRLFRALEQPLITCWPVVTEAAYMLRHQPRGVSKLLEALQNATLLIEPIRSDDLPPIAELLKRYESLALQLADASLLQLADRLDASQILTFDRRDFSVAQTPLGRALQQIEVEP